MRMPSRAFAALAPVATLAFVLLGSAPVLGEPLGERLSGYFHYHGARGGLLLMLDRRREAREAFDRAIALANTAAEAAHIRMHIDRLIAESEKTKRA